MSHGFQGAQGGRIQGQGFDFDRVGQVLMVDAPNGESYLVHLCGRPLKDVVRCPHGRETGLQKTQWTEDGWLRLPGATGDGLPQLMVSSPDIKEQPWPEVSTCHEFDSAILPSEFQWLRSPEPGTFMSLSDRPGYLRLKGKSSLGNWFEQALVARRQEAFCFSAETKLEFSPVNFQQCAGLVCYYNAHKYHYLYVSVDEQGRRFVDIASCLGDPSGQATYSLSVSRGDSASDDIGIEIPQKGAVWLRCDVEYAELVFSWSLDGQQWQKIPVTLDYSLISDEAGKGEGASFTGAFVGMCCQDVSGTELAADFDYFHYNEVE